MKKYCPRWVFKCAVAQTCFDYIEMGAGLNVISKKYSQGLNKLYDDREIPSIDRTASQFLKICADLKINEKSIELMSENLYFNFYYVNTILKRKFNTLFGNVTFSKYPRYPNEEDTVKKFFLFTSKWISSDRKKHKKGWNLKLQNEFQDLKKLAQTPFSDEVNKIIIEEKKKDDFLSTWTKN